MVGGKVIGLARRADSTLVHVAEIRHGAGQGEPERILDTCSIRVREERCRDGSPVRIELGDSLWWQAGRAFWTPAAEVTGEHGRGCGTRYDIALPKLGYSH